jgi:hypothetical protein
VNWAIDENVIAVANDVARIERGEQPRCPQADDACRLACITFLATALKSGKVLLDTAEVVFGYYRRKASMSGQPGSGDAFLRQLFQVMHDEDFVIRVDLPAAPAFGLPTAFVTCGFDLDDFIYVALATAQPQSRVANAVDSDYHNFAVELAKLPATVTELCTQCLAIVP